MTERFHPSEFIREEMNERGWDDLDMAARMGGDPVNSLLELQMYLAVGETGDPRLRLGEMAGKLAKAFGTSVGFWLNLERAFLGEPMQHREG